MQNARQSLKAFARAVLPRPVFERIAAVRSRRWQVAFLERNGLLDQVKKHLVEHGTAIQAGPFAGMVYPRESALVRWCVPKLLGSYELELHPFLNTLSKRKYDCVIDIGSAEGYYACGLARMFRVPVYAYDPEPYEKKFSAMMAECNGVSDLVKMADLFTEKEMKSFANQRALVICDCEGFEETLFRPETLEFARNWDLLIELHGTADKTLPALAWPHATHIVAAERRTGLRDEHRASYPQHFLLCDAQPDRFI